MEINSVYGSALQGIQSGLEGVERSATVVAQAPVENEQVQQKSTTEALVEAKTYSNQVSASAKTLEIADETVGTLLDEKV